MPISSPIQVGELLMSGYSANSTGTYTIANDQAAITTADNSALYVVIRTFARATSGFTVAPITFSIATNANVSGVSFSLAGSSTLQVGNTYFSTYVFATNNKIPSIAKAGLSIKVKANTGSNTDVGLQFGAFAAQMCFVTGVDSRQPFSTAYSGMGNTGTGASFGSIWNRPHAASDRQISFHQVRYIDSDPFPSISGYNPATGSGQSTYSTSGGGGFGYDPDGYYFVYQNDMSTQNAANLGYNVTYPTGSTYAIATFFMVFRSADVSVSLAATGYGTTGTATIAVSVTAALSSTSENAKRAGLPQGNFAQVEVISASPATSPSVPSSISFTGEPSMAFTMLTSRLVQGTNGGYVLYSVWLSTTPAASTYTSGTFTVNLPSTYSANHSVVVSAVGGAPKSNPLRQYITQGYSSNAGPATISFPSSTQETAQNGVYASVASTYASSLSTTPTTTPNSTYSSSAAAGTASNPSTQPAGWDTNAGAIAYAPVYVATYPASNTVNSYYTPVWQSNVTASSGSNTAAWIVAALEYRSEVALTVLTLLGDDSLTVSDSPDTITGPQGQPILFKAFTGTDGPTVSEGAATIDSTTLTGANAIALRAVGSATASSFVNVTATNNVASILQDSVLIVEVWERLTSMNNAFIDDTVTVTGGGFTWTKVNSVFAYPRSGSSDGTGQRLTVFTTAHRVAAQAQGALTLTVNNPNSVPDPDHYGIGGASGTGITRVSITAATNTRATNFLQIYTMDWNATTQSSGGGFYFNGGYPPPSGAAKQYFSLWGQNSSSTTLTGQDSSTSNTAAPYALTQLASNSENQAAGVNTLQLQAYRTSPVNGTNVLAMLATNGNTPSNFTYFAAWLVPANIPERFDLDRLGLPPQTFNLINYFINPTLEQGAVAAFTVANGSTLSNPVLPNGNWGKKALLVTSTGAAGSKGMLYPVTWDAQQWFSYRVRVRLTDGAAAAGISAVPIGFDSSGATIAWQTTGTSTVPQTVAQDWVEFTGSGFVTGTGTTRVGLQFNFISAHTAGVGLYIDDVIMTKTSKQYPFFTPNNLDAPYETRVGHWDGNPYQSTSTYTETTPNPPVDKVSFTEALSITPVIPSYPILSDSLNASDGFSFAQVIRGLDDAANVGDSMPTIVDSSITVAALAGNSGSGSGAVVPNVSVTLTGLNAYVGSLLLVEVTRGDSTTALQSSPVTDAAVTASSLTAVGMTWKPVVTNVRASGATWGGVEQSVFASSEIPGSVPSGSVTLTVTPASYTTTGATTLHVRVSVVSNARQAKPFGQTLGTANTTAGNGTTSAFSLPIGSESATTLLRSRGYVSAGYQFPASTVVQPTTGWTQQTTNATSVTTSTTVGGVLFGTANTGWQANDSSQISSFQGRLLNNSPTAVSQVALIGVEFVHKSLPSNWNLGAETLTAIDSNGAFGRVVDLAGELLNVADSSMLPPILDLRETIGISEPTTLRVQLPTQAETTGTTESMSAGQPNYRATTPDTSTVLDSLITDTRRFLISSVAPLQHADYVSVYEYFTATMAQTLGYDGPVNFTDSDLVLTTPSGGYLKFFENERGDSTTSVVDLFRVGAMVQIVDTIRLLESMTPPNATLYGGKLSELTKLTETFRIYDAARGSSTTDEWWSIDDVSLHQQAWNITTLGGSRFGVPALRGEDVQMSNRPGRIWVPKIPDSRVITLVMWMAAIDPDTGSPPSYDQLIQWNDNWNYLRRLFYSPKRQKTLTRRWKLNRTNPRIEKASAKVQLGGTMDPSMTGRTRATFSVDLVLADPYFYGPLYEESVKVTLKNSTSLANRRGIFNPGDDTAGFTNMTVTFFGPLTNPRLVNSSGANGPIWMKLNTANIGALQAGEQVTFDIETFKANRITTVGGQPSGSSKVVTASVTHSGSVPWFSLEPGDNIVVLEADAGTGSALISYRPPFV